MSLQEAPDSLSRLPGTLGFYFTSFWRSPKEYRHRTTRVLGSCSARVWPGPRLHPSGTNSHGRGRRKDGRPQSLPICHLAGSWRTHAQSSPQGPHPVMAICSSQCPWPDCFEGRPLHPFTCPVPSSCWTQAMEVFSVESPQWPAQKPRV